MDGDVSEGDFRLSFKCALYLAGVGACIATTVATGGALPLVLLGVGGQCVLASHGWSSSGCASTVPDIGRGRR